MHHSDGRVCGAIWSVRSCLKSVAVLPALRALASRFSCNLLIRALFSASSTVIPAVSASARKSRPLSNVHVTLLLEKVNFNRVVCSPHAGFAFSNTEVCVSDCTELLQHVSLQQRRTAKKQVQNRLWGYSGRSNKWSAECKMRLCCCSWTHIIDYVVPSSGSGSAYKAALVRTGILIRKVLHLWRARAPRYDRDLFPVRATSRLDRVWCQLFHYTLTSTIITVARVWCTAARRCFLNCWLYVHQSAALRLLRCTTPPYLFLLPGYARDRRAKNGCVFCRLLCHCVVAVPARRWPFFYYYYFFIYDCCSSLASWDDAAAGRTTASCH